MSGLGLIWSHPKRGRNRRKVEGEDHLPWIAALGLLNGVDLNAVQTSGGGRVEPRAGIYFGVCAGPIGTNGSTRQGFESEAAIDVRCLSESLSNCLGDLLGHGIANVQDQVKTSLCTPPMRC
jgi:hypothetical protein